MKVKHTTKTENIFSLAQGCCSKMSKEIKNEMIYVDPMGKVFMGLYSNTLNYCPWCSEKIEIDWCKN